MLLVTVISILTRHNTSIVLLEYIDPFNINCNDYINQGGVPILGLALPYI